MDENNPIEGLDPSQSAFEPLMDQTMPEGVQGMRTRVLGLKLGYIEQMGRHLGEGENDVGEYREFKNEWHAKNLGAFHKNAREYMRREKSYYVDFKDVE